MSSLTAVGPSLPPKLLEIARTSNPNPEAPTALVLFAEDYNYLGPLYKISTTQFFVKTLAETHKVVMKIINRKSAIGEAILSLPEGKIKLLVFVAHGCLFGMNPVMSLGKEPEEDAEQEKLIWTKEQIRSLSSSANLWANLWAKGKIEDEKILQRKDIRALSPFFERLARNASIMVHGCELGEMAQEMAEVSGLPTFGSRESLAGENVCLTACPVHHMLEIRHYQLEDWKFGKQTILRFQKGSSEAICCDSGRREDTVYFDKQLEYIRQEAQEGKDPEAQVTAVSLLQRERVLKIIEEVHVTESSEKPFSEAEGIEKFLEQSKRIRETFEEILPVLVHAAEQGSVPAQSQLVKYYTIKAQENFFRAWKEKERGQKALNLGLETEDRSMMNHWMRKAAEGKAPEAAFSMGCTERAEGHLVEAKIWFQKALSAGNLEALLYLGRLYENDEGDVEKAQACYEEILKLGSLEVVTEEQKKVIFSAKLQLEHLVLHQRIKKVLIGGAVALALGGVALGGYLLLRRKRA